MLSLAEALTNYSSLSTRPGRLSTSLDDIDLARSELG